jgi:single-stranded DNA-binding protein
MALINLGEYALCWGGAVNIKNSIMKTGKSVTQFSIQYGKDGDTKLYQNCTAWNDLSRKYLNRLDKGDLVLVVGRMEKDDYWSERNGKDEYKLNVEWASVQDSFDSDDVDEELDLSDL